LVDRNRDKEATRENQGDQAFGSTANQRGRRDGRHGSELETEGIGKLSDPENGKQAEPEEFQKSEVKEHQRIIAEERDRRLQLYRRDDVRRFAAWMLRGHEEIQPQRNLETGEYDYSKSGFDHPDFGKLVTELNSHEILQAYLMDTTPGCSKCGHSRFHLVYLCPFSQHSTLERGAMIEHYRCGHTDFETSFRSGNELVCPKCRRMLKVIGTDYRKIEWSYRCNGCGRKFDTPISQFVCAHCGWSNRENGLLMQPVYGYRLNKVIRSELLSHCSLEAKIAEVLKQLGFEVTAPTVVEGLSGTMYSFDVGAKKEQTQFVFDMISDTDEIGPQDIAAFFAKVYDARPPSVLLIATPRVSREAERLCTMYGIELIAGEELNAISNRLLDTIANINGAKASITETKAPTNEKLVSYPEQLNTAANEEPTSDLIDQKVGKTETKSPDDEESLDHAKDPDEIVRRARIKLSQLVDELEQRLSV